jgi:hypothetical protein
MLLHSTPDIILQNTPPVLHQNAHQLQQQVRNSANIYIRMNIVRKLCGNKLVINLVFI